jgi:steroid delta-isomerase-like uncharacterized protein
MSVDDNKRLMHDFIDEWNKGDTEALDRLIDEIVHPDFVNHNSASAEEARGPEGVKKMFAEFREAFPDGRTTIEAVVAEGDTVVTRWTFRGTQEAEFAGFAPTGRQVTLAGINIDRIADGKFVERWYQSDTLSLIQQLDATS